MKPNQSTKLPARIFVRVAIFALLVSCGDNTSSTGPDGQHVRRGTAPSIKRGGAGTIVPPELPGYSLAPATGATPEQLAQLLVGQGVSVSNVTYTGAPAAAGTFSGGTGIVGFETGIILSTGSIQSVVGPNVQNSVTSVNETPGDARLTAQAGQPTFDAAVLSFTFVPTSTQIFIQFVFSSDEYNEFVGGSFNDAFAFFVNSVNCARAADGSGVSVNSINAQINANQYRNNELPNATVDTEMDGLTTVLTCQAQVPVGVPSTMVLAIADASDDIYDSNVFIRAGSLSTLPPNLAPVAVAGVDLVRECTAVNTSVGLNGTGSTDADGNIVTYRWLRNGVQIATGATPTVALAVGVHTIVLEVTDNGTATATDTVVVTVQDTTAPTLTFGATPTILSIADHTYRTVTFNTSASDLCGGTITFAHSVVSNEPDNAASRDGTTTGDIRVTRPGNIVVVSSLANPIVQFNPLTDVVELRSERRGAAADRQYTVTAIATDARANARTSTAVVRVPRDGG